MNTLRQNYQLCKTELSNMKRDQAPKPAKSIANKTNEVESADPRKALFAAIQKRGANVDNNLSKPPVDPRQALFAAIKNKGADNSNNTSVATPYIKYSRGVKKLESFIWKAEATLSLTEREQGAAIRACKVSDFCHENRHHNFLHTDDLLLSFPLPRVLLYFVERKEARDLPRHCSKFYQPLRLRL